MTTFTRIFSLHLYGCLLVIFLGLGCNNSSSKLFSNSRMAKSTFYSELDFELLRDLIIVEPAINGRKRRMILDTGASNVLSVQLFEEGGFKKFSDRTVGDSQGQSSRIDFVRIDSIAFGDLKVYQSTAAVIDFAAISAFDCFRIEGILGANFMRHAYWQIDYPRKKIIISSDKSRLNLGEHVETMSFRSSSQGTPLISVKVGQKSFSDGIIDTGSGGGISVFEKSVKRTSNLLYSQYGINRVGAFGGVKDTLKVYGLDSLSINGKALGRQPYVSQRLGSTKVGNLFFKYYILTLDWKNRQFHLGKPTAEEAYSGIKNFGFGFMPTEEKLYVVSLILGSEAERQGLAIGNQLISINGQSVENIPNEVFCNQFWLKDAPYLSRPSMQLVVRDTSTQELKEFTFSRIDWLQTK